MTEERSPPFEISARLKSAIQHHQRGELEEAETAYRAILDSDPTHSTATANLAALAHQTGRGDLALSLLEEAVREHTDQPILHLNLGVIYQQRGRVEEAISSLSLAAAAMPETPQARIALSRAYTTRGAACTQQGRDDDAHEDFRRAVDTDDSNGTAHYNLGTCLKNSGQLAAAEKHLRRALQIAPEQADTHNNLANTLKAQGRCREAVDSYRLALALDPEDPHRGSNLLLALHYDGSLSPREMLKEHTAWAARHAQPTRTSARHRTGDVLRIGYVSGDFRNHSVAHFIEPVLRAHDRKRVSVSCYAQVVHPDEVTDRLRALSDHWRDTTSLDDKALLEQIDKDRIDVLIDLAGHTQGHRLCALSAKPAAVMLTYLGYPDTTGIDSFDGRIVDAHTDPVGASDEHTTEALLRIEGGFLCYQARHDAPPVQPPPFVDRGHITFGSLNALPKITPAVVKHWSQILGACDRSQLLLKSPSFEDMATRTRYESLFAQHNISADRLSFLGFVEDEREHLACYHTIDIALDPFPYNGTTTTCEALWMGVPVVTLRGERHAGRVGSSLLTRVGLQHLCADTIEQYVQIAVELASDRENLRRLRAKLRDDMAASPLCDATRMARALETAYIDTHQRWREANE